MARSDAIKQYQKALQSGKRFQTNAVISGQYPYLPALEDYVSETVLNVNREIGVMDIPLDAVVGTRTSGRKQAFAGNFMPLLAQKTEFGIKWINLCEAQLDGGGIRDSIRCIEYLGRFYVQEGNKRVSVLKSLEAATISAQVMRVVPDWNDTPEIKTYYEFLHFFELSHTYDIRFERPGCYAKLQAALGFEPDHVWTDEERNSFRAAFTRFKQAFSKKHREQLNLTPSDALLVWLKVNPFSDLKECSIGELRHSLNAVWPDVKAAASGEKIAVTTAPTEPDKGIINLFSRVVRPTKLQVAFIHAQVPKFSNWVKGHDEGRAYLEAAMGDKVKVESYFLPETEEKDEVVMERAIREGAQVVFATSPLQIGACRKMAAKYPNVKILNCSIGMPYTGIRTYYSRMYEGKFLSGVVAGTLSRGDDIGYIASYPIFGVLAGINAFALGVQLTNPAAKIHLRWYATDMDALSKMDAAGIRLVSNRDVPTVLQYQAEWGLTELREDGKRYPLLTPFWNWGFFYEKVITSILNGAWDKTGAQAANQAVNYWWGIQSGVIGVRCSKELPEGSNALLEILKRDMKEGRLDPFHRVITDQNGTLRSDGSHWFTPEELINMDWLCDNILGEIPSFEELTLSAQSIVRMQGIYRDSLTPEKEGIVL